MITDKEKNIIYFDNDDEFYIYAVKPELIPIKTDHIDKYGNPVYYTDWNFTDVYNNAINNGSTFIIKDENSQIFKHGAVSYRTITKPIQNLEQYFADL